MIIGDDGWFAKYGEGWREFILRRWRPRALGRSVDDTNDTGGGGGGDAATLEVDAKIPMISSFSSSATVSSPSSSSEMIIGDDGRFIKYRAGWRRLILRRWRPRDLAELRLEGLGLAVDDAIATGGGAAPSEFDGRISTMSSMPSSTLASSSSATTRSSRIMSKLEEGGLTSIIHLNVDGISATSIVKLTRRVLFLLKYRKLI